MTQTEQQAVEHVARHGFTAWPSGKEGKIVVEHWTSTRDGARFLARDTLPADLESLDQWLEKKAGAE